MSDIYLPLCDAIETQLAASVLTGEPLEDVRAYFVNRTGSELPPEYGARAPLIVVNVGPIASETVSIPGCMMRKEYPVSFKVYTQNAGDTRRETAATILDTIEDVFFNETFGLSEYVSTTSKDYAQALQEPFAGNWNGSAELIMTHLHTDVRAL